MTIEERSQMALGEEEQNDATALAAIEDHQGRRAQLEDAQEAFRSAEKILQGVIQSRNLAPGEHRFGRYIVTLSNVPAHQRIRVRLAKSGEQTASAAPERSHVLGEEGEAILRHAFQLAPERAGEPDPACSLCGMVQGNEIHIGIGESYAGPDDRTYVHQNGERKPPADEAEAMQQ